MFTMLFSIPGLLIIIIIIIIIVSSSSRRSRSSSSSSMFQKISRFVFSLSVCAVVYCLAKRLPQYAPQAWLSFGCFERSAN